MPSADAPEHHYHPDRCHPARECKLSRRVRPGHRDRGGPRRVGTARLAAHAKGAFRLGMALFQESMRRLHMRAESSQAQPLSAYLGRDADGRRHRIARAAASISTDPAGSGTGVAR